ncbi:SPX domain-containing protein, partial [Blyttiomyces helicus]
MGKSGTAKSDLGVDPSSAIDRIFIRARMIRREIEAKSEGFVAEEVGDPGHAPPPAPTDPMYNMLCGAPKEDYFVVRGGSSAPGNAERIRAVQIESPLRCFCKRKRYVAQVKMADQDEPEWHDFYLPYSNLKKIIYAIEKATLGLATLPASARDIETGEEGDFEVEDETARLLIRPISHEDANAYFMHALDEQLEKIVTFYARKERELSLEVESLIADVADVETNEESYLSIENMHRGGAHDPGSAISSRPLVAEPQGSPITPQSAASASTPYVNGATSSGSRGPRSRRSVISDLEYLPYVVWSSKALKLHRTKFRKRATDAFVLLCELKDYAELNYTGFLKILKKYDKVTGNRLRGEYIAAKVDIAHPFLPETKTALNGLIDRVVAIFARVGTDGKLAIALTELKSNLREYIVWERNTIWRDMIEKERKRETIGIRPKSIAEGEDDVWTREVQICGGFYRVPKVSKNAVLLVFSLAVFVTLLLYPTFESVEQRNCLAILVLASLLWALE